jgi:tape measure domain-containing protein
VAKNLLVRVGADLTEFDREMARVSGTLSRLESTTDRMAAGFRRLGEHIASVGSALTVALTAPLVGFATIAVKAAADMDALRRGLIAVGGSAEEADRQLKRLVETAKLPGLGLKEAVQAAIQLQAVGFAFKDAVRIIEAFGNALATVGRGREDLNEVIRQLGQLESRGKVTADNLKPILERVPQAARIIKEAFGTIDTEVLQKMGIRSREFINTLVSELEKLPKVTSGIKNELENMRDAIERALARAGDALVPFTEKLLNVATTAIDALRGMVEWFLKLPQPVQEWTIRLAALAAAIGPVLFAVGQLVEAIGALYKIKVLIPPLLDLVSLGFRNFAAAASAAMMATSPAGLTGLTAALYALKEAVLLTAAAWTGWQLGRWIDENIVSKVGALNKFIEIVAAFPAAVYQKIIGVSGDASRAMRDLESATKALEDRLRAHGIVVERGNMTTEQYAAALRRAAEQAGLFKSAQQQVEQATRRKIQATVDDQQETRRLVEAQREAERQARELTEALVALGVRTREEVRLEELRKQVDLLHLAFAQGKISAYELSVAWDNYIKTLERVRDPLAFMLDEVPKLNATIKEQGVLFSHLDAVMRQAAVGSVQWWAQLHAELGEISDAVEKLARSSGDHWKTLEAAMGRTPKLIGVATEEVKKHNDAWTKAGKQVSTVLTDMSRGIADVILKGKSLGDVMTQTFMQIARAALRYVIEEALGGIARAIANLIKGEVASLGQAFSGLFKQIEDIGRAIARAFGGGGAAAKTPSRGAAGGGGGAGAPAVAGGGLAGWLDFATNLISSILGYFQGRRIEQDVARIEVTTRGILSQLQSLQDSANQWWPWMRNLADPAWEAVNLLTGIHDLLRQMLEGLAGAAANAARSIAPTSGGRALAPATAPVNVNVSVRADARAIADDVATTIARSLKSAGYVLE